MQSIMNCRILICFRKLSLAAIKELKDMGYVAVHWNHNPEDWIHSGDRDKHVLKYVKSSIPKAGMAASGPIILQHDFAPATIRHQKSIIKSLKKKGYTLVPMDKCLGFEAYQSISVDC